LVTGRSDEPGRDVGRPDGWVEAPFPAELPPGVEGLGFGVVPLVVSRSGMRMLPPTARGGE
jgi:hypothetical protein